MDFSLSDEQKLLQSQLVEFARKELNAGMPQRDREGQFSHDLWRKCGERRLMGLPVPEEDGGKGLDPLSTAIALEALGYGCEDGGLIFSICAHLLGCVVSIWKHGSAEQKRRYLPKLSNGTLIAVCAMTEPDSGSDAFALSTTAERDGEGFRINGTKTLATNGPIAGLAVVYAATTSADGFSGISAFLVEQGTPGYRVGRTFEKMGLCTAVMSELIFEDVWVANAALLGQVGAGAQLFSHAMEWER